MKRFSYVQNIGRCRHVINFHDGVKTHADGSAFYDMTIFSNKRDARSFIKKLLAAGYLEA